jgi:hypothetical protein
MMEYIDFARSRFSEVSATLSNQRKRIRKERETSFKGCSEKQPRRFHSNAELARHPPARPLAVHQFSTVIRWNLCISWKARFTVG